MITMKDREIESANDNTRPTISGYNKEEIITLACIKYKWMIMIIMEI